MVKAQLLILLLLLLVFSSSPSAGEMMMLGLEGLSGFGAARGGFSDRRNLCEFFHICCFALGQTLYHT